MNYTRIRSRYCHTNSELILLLLSVHYMAGSSSSSSSELYGLPWCLEVSVAVCYVSRLRSACMRPSRSHSCQTSIIAKRFLQGVQCCKHKLTGRFSQPTRNLATESPFTVNTNVKSDTLIYRHDNKRFHFLVSTFGVVQLVFWLNLTSYIQKVRVSEEIKSKMREIRFFGPISVFAIERKSFFALLFFGFGTLFLLTLVS